MQFGALIVDAKRFVPQSRPRVFLIAVDSRVDCSALTRDEPTAMWSSEALISAKQRLPADLQEVWRWWNLPAPQYAAPSLLSIIERDTVGVKWNSQEQTDALLAMMSPTNRDKVAQALRLNNFQVEFLYKRIRNGIQRAEICFDGVAGCLRTPQRGSSRQTVMILERGQIRSRLLSPRETARLMGVPDDYVLPANYSDAYRAMGDGVAVPAMRWLSKRLLAPLASIADGRSTTKSKHPRMNDLLQISESWARQRTTKANGQRHHREQIT